MRFKEFRAFMMMLNADHHPDKQLKNDKHRHVTLASCTTRVCNGDVIAISLSGPGWTQKFEGERMEQDAMSVIHGGRMKETVIQRPITQEMPKHETAIDAVVAIVTDELGKNSVRLGDPLGVKEVKLTIPMDVIKQAIDEMEKLKLLT